MAEAHIAEIAVGDGDIDDHAPLRIEVVHGLAQHEEEGACIGTVPRGVGDVEKLHVLVVVEPEIESHDPVVYLRAYGSVRHFQPESRKNLRKPAPHREFLDFFIIFAADF
jgi:hypothetical protein